MTSRERVLAALAHKEADRIPFDVGSGGACKMTRGFYVKLLDYLGIKEEPVIQDFVTQGVNASVEVLKAIGTDVADPMLQSTRNPSPCEKKWEDETSRYVVDPWGITYRMLKSPGYYYDVVGSPLLNTEEDADADYFWPDCEPVFEEGAAQKYRDLKAQGFFTSTISVYGNGFLQMAPRLYGYEDWLSMLIVDKDRARAFLDKFLERKIRFFENYFKSVENEVDMVCEFDDFGTQISQFVSPAIFKEMILPYHKELFGAIEKMSPNTTRFLHSCGAIEPCIGDLIDVGVQVINPVQISATDMNPFKLKEKYGKDIVFWGGGVDTQKILPTGTKQEVADDVKRNIDALAPGGGFVFSAVHQIQPDVPVENFMTMVETFQKYSSY